jgi:hypothetical protein
VRLLLVTFIATIKDKLIYIITEDDNLGIIKIPSSYIYNIKTISLGTENIITGTTGNLNKFDLKNGNVISQNYTINFWSKDENGTYTYVGDSEINPVLFSQKADGDAIRAVLKDANEWKFKIEKVCFPILTDDNGEVTNYTLIRKQYFDKGYGTSELIDEKKENVLKYDKDTNSFIWYYGKRNDYNMIIKTAANVYIVKEEISIVGDYYDISSYSFENGASNFNLPSNELVQYENLYDNFDYKVALSSAVLDKYRNGKEVYVIKCSIGEYYDLDGNLIISPKNKQLSSYFKKYDIVRPFLFTNNGEVDLSYNEDGTPKQFEIIGIDYSYKGIVWQELTLQEYA